MGSCTALVALVREGRLYVSNLGDSGMMVLRKSKTKVAQIVYRTKEQQHSFNCPFQLGTGSSDVPEKSTEAEVDLKADGRCLFCPLNAGYRILNLSANQTF